MNNYSFIVPEYKYKISTISPLIEIYRFNLMNEFVDELYNKIKILNNNKVYQYFSQLIMSIISDKTNIPYNIDTIYLDDGLFNNCTIEHTDQFYKDISYATKKTFTNDEFHIVDNIKQIIDKISEFVNKSDLTFNFTTEYVNNKYYFKINNSNLTKYKNIKNLDYLDYLQKNLVLDDYVMNNCKKHYKGDTSQFHKLVLCCLIRYATLHSGANQFVVDLQYKDQLKTFGLNFECFGSVFNRYFDNFCSMFYDLEKDFGSKGSFMGLKIIKGFYMANPPYDENLLKNMYDRVKLALKSEEPVIFIMSIPKWENYKLETDIDNDKLYDVKHIKHERFHDPMNIKNKVLIPDYISYLFFNDEYKKQHHKYVQNITKTFLEFKNI